MRWLVGWGLAVLLSAPVRADPPSGQTISPDLVLLRDLVDHLVAAKQRILALETQAATTEVLAFREQVEQRLRTALACPATHELDWKALTCAAKPPPPMPPPAQSPDPPKAKF